MRRVMAGTTVINGLGTLAPQAVALFTLDAVGFGRFSIGYLAYALAVSLLFSTLCDPWVGLAAKHSLSTAWSDYVGVLAPICSILAILGGLVTAIGTQDIAFAFWVGLAVALNAYRVGARYLFVYEGKWRRVVMLDTVALAGTGLGLASASLLESSSMAIVLSTWLGAGVLATLSAGKIGYSFSALRSWFSGQRRSIAKLLADSAAMDAAAIGTPFILLPFLGLQAFGVYRAISTLSAPVRLLLAPFRSVIVGAPGTAASRRMTSLVSGCSALVGLLSVICLLTLERMGWDFGTVGEIGPHRILAGVYVASALLLSYFPLVCRGAGDGRSLFLGRAVQMVLGIALPLMGVGLFGLEGAIWGFAASALISGLIWILLAKRHRPAV